MRARRRRRRRRTSVLRPLRGLPSVEPWLVTVVLSYLKPEIARATLTLLPVELQAKIKSGKGAKRSGNPAKRAQQDRRQIGNGKMCGYEADSQPTWDEALAYWQVNAREY